MRTLSFRVRGDKALAQQYRWAGERLFRQLSDDLDLTGTYSGTLRKTIDGVRITARVIGGDGVVTVEAPEGGGGECEEETFSPATWFWVDPAAVGDEYAIGKKAGWFAGPEVPQDEVTYGRYYWVGGTRPGVAVCRTTGARRSVAGKSATPHVISWLSTTAYALGQRLFMVPMAETIYAAWYYGEVLICVAGGGTYGYATKCYRVTLGETPETATFETLATWPFDITASLWPIYQRYVPMSVKSDGTHGVYAWQHAEANVNMSRDEDGLPVATVTAVQTTVMGGFGGEAIWSRTDRHHSYNDRARQRVPGFGGDCTTGRQTYSENVSITTTLPEDEIVVGKAYDHADVLHTVSVRFDPKKAEESATQEWSNTIGLNEAGTVKVLESAKFASTLSYRRYFIFNAPYALLVDGVEVAHNGRVDEEATSQTAEWAKPNWEQSKKVELTSTVEVITAFWWHPYSNSYSVTWSRTQSESTYFGTGTSGSVEGDTCVLYTFYGNTSGKIRTRGTTSTTSRTVLAGREVSNTVARSGPNVQSIAVNSGNPVVVPFTYEALPPFGTGEEDIKLDAGSIEVYAPDLTMYDEGVDYELLDTTHTASHIVLLEGGAIEPGSVVSIRWTVTFPALLESDTVYIAPAMNLGDGDGVDGPFLCYAGDYNPWAGEPLPPPCQIAIDESDSGTKYVSSGRAANLHSPDQSPNINGWYVASNGHGSILKLTTEGYLVPLPTGAFADPLEVLGLDPTTYQVGAT